MKTSINEYEFVGVMAKPEHGFSRNGARALFEYFEEYEEDTGEEIEFDPVAFRCEYAEYRDIDEFNNEYFGPGSDESKDFTLESLRDETIVIEFENGFIVQEF